MVKIQTNREVWECLDCGEYKRVARKNYSDISERTYKCNNCWTLSVHHRIVHFGTNRLVPLNMANQ